MFITGVISLSSLRKPDLEASYLLNVSVTDGVFTAFTRVLINVQNSNNHAPAFPHAVYDVDIAENMAAGRQIAEVKALDPDMGIYGDVRYDISSEDLKEFFRIDEETGKKIFFVFHTPSGTHIHFNTLPVKLISVVTWLHDQ